jgi:hypothetical protein
MPQKQTHTQTMSTRAFSSLPSTVDVDSRSFDITITTETPVRTVISDPREPEKMIEVDEVLSVAGLDLSRADRMPLVDCHDTEGGLGKILGKVDDIRIEGTTVIGRAVLNTRNADLAADIAGGFYGQVSAGYVVGAYVIEEREGNRRSHPHASRERPRCACGCTSPPASRRQRYRHGFKPSPSARAIDVRRGHRLDTARR